MPKKACSDLQGIRFELQQSERDTLEAYLAANGVGQILQGIGSMLTPFAGAFTALAAAFLAGEIADDAKKFLDGVVNKNREKLAAPAIHSYQAITAFLYPETWPLDTEKAGAFKKSPNGKKTTIPQKWMRKRFQAFINQTKNSMFRSQMQTQGLTPAEAWSLFYPYEEMENEAIWEFNKNVGAINPILDFLTPAN